MRAWALVYEGLIRRLVLVVWTLLFAAVLTGCGCASDDPTDDGPRPIREVPAGAVFYLGDHQGSPVAVTNARGEVIREKAYHPYGSTRHERGDSADPFAYVGNERDRGSGLSDFNARPYREQAGVFLAPDPVAVFQPEKVLEEPQRLSAYGYCGGDAINRSDPSGELWPAVLAGVAVAVGITIAAQYANAPTRTNPETKHKDTPEMALEATANAISIYNATRALVAVAQAGLKWAVQRAAKEGAGQAAGQEASARAAEGAVAEAKVGDRVYRVWGGDARAHGHSWSRVDPRSVPNYRDVAGLPNQNTGRFVSEGRLTSTQGVRTREALPLHGNRGTLDEVLIPNPKPQVQLERVSGANPEF